METKNNLVYDRPKVELYEDLIPEHQKTLEWIGQGKQVLEAGCHTGFLTEWIKQQGCSVTGVELDAVALDKASPHLDQAINGSIESEEVWSKLSGQKFDVILYMHVLEHLVDPWNTLKRSHGILREGGIVIIALPNIANLQTRMHLFKGNFDYTVTGVLDKTHLRFFNIRTARDMIREANFVEAEYYSSWQVNLLLHLRLLWRLNKLSQKIISKFSNNLSDVVMMFRLEAKNDKTL